MLTIFAIPKPFHDHIGIIQRNAIRSWTRLEPTPQIILFGDEHGTSEIAAELGVTHVPQISCNEYGTPLLNDMLTHVEAIANYETLCYVNSDIILMSDFMRAAQKIMSEQKRFLMGAQRWDVDIQEQLCFDCDWETQLRDRARTHGRLDPPGSIDVFLYSKGLWKDVPPFAIGRFYWDNWLLYQARKSKAALVDASSSMMIIHQRHGYRHNSLGDRGVQGAEGALVVRAGPEGERNLKLAGGGEHLYLLIDASHLLTPEGLKRKQFGRDEVVRLQISWIYFGRRVLKALEQASQPTSYFGYPARALLRLIKLTGPIRHLLHVVYLKWAAARAEQRRKQL